MEARRLRVGVLGATGLVGQQLVQLLSRHPWFELSALAASENSAGRLYGEAVNWRLDGEPPQPAAALAVSRLDPTLECDFVFSALDAKVAGDAELAFAAAGYPVISNAAAHRLHDYVPLLVPEVNPGHLTAISYQQERLGFTRGFILTNPNCSAIGLTMVLKPLQDTFGVFAATVVTMQAISGAGLGQLAAATAQDNVVPFIAGEETKLESEPLKLLGRWDGGRFKPADVVLSASCHRVPILHGHTELVSLRLGSQASVEAITKALQDFRGLPQELRLPSAPEQPLQVVGLPDRPQPRLDRSRSSGMAVTVGRIRPCPVLGWKLVLVLHNLIRGAAGAALLNAELLCAQGLIPGAPSAGSDD
ncbi:MAG: aspartate-semialdehyde dehydrogenase [Candidatus Dormibacteria bacterium]